MQDEAEQAMNEPLDELGAGSGEIEPSAYLMGATPINIGHGTSLWRLSIKQEHLNPFGFVGGPVIFMLVDIGMETALNGSMVDDREPPTTIETNIRYIKAPRSGTLECHSKPLYIGERVATLEAEVLCDGALVAKASSSWTLVPVQKG